MKFFSESRSFSETRGQGRVRQLGEEVRRPGERVGPPGQHRGRAQLLGS